MRTLVILCLSQLLATVLNAQTTFKGKVTERNGSPILGANVIVEGTYYGATSNTQGEFSVTLNNASDSVLIISSLGYKSSRININSLGSNFIEVKLSPSYQEIEEVRISAGTFLAGDKVKNIGIEPLDIVTTASANADLYGVLNTLPGTSPNIGEGGVFVRGGNMYETKTFFDGLIVERPYTSKVPDMAVRSRFNALQFSGTHFSTGGFSAEYGQALSSVLSLNTSGIDDRDKLDLTIHPAGLSIGHSHVMEESMYSIYGEYSNFGPYAKLYGNSEDYTSNPQTYSGTIGFKQKIGEEGMLKFFGYGSRNSVALYLPFEFEDNVHFANTNDNIYGNLSANIKLNDCWVGKMGAAYSYDVEDIGFDNSEIKYTNRMNHIKLGAKGKLSKQFSLNQGAEFYYKNYDFYYDTDTLAAAIDVGIDIYHTAVFFEPKITLGNRFSIRPGIRTEYTQFNDELVLLPRLSAAYRLNKNNHISGSAGYYSQLPKNDYLFFNKNLQSEKATHLILNYEYKQDRKLFRIELYQKEYKNLITFKSEYQYIADNFSNEGNGMANGIDVFYRDKSFFNHGDFWISYSYVNSYRKFDQFQEAVQPNFLYNHNLSLVYKKYFFNIKSLFGATFTYADGKKYYNPAGEYQGNVKPFKDVSISYNYVTSIFDRSFVIFFMANNVFGFKNVFNYKYVLVSGTQNEYQKITIEPLNRTFAFFGFYLQLNNNQ